MKVTQDGKRIIFDGEADLILRNMNERDCAIDIDLDDKTDVTVTHFYVVGFNNFKQKVTASIRALKYIWRGTIGK